ncbi:3-oxoacyl-ACP synthase [Winogradskyella sp.]|uniref:3-oxoacyl-ACP synthase n=1 Tax=Winogradskyella sp. TaxID=1883156 RepID=UPI002624EB8A|nr:3-oxoacyl-ACP synthase [Winogradskyella sp.]
MSLKLSLYNQCRDILNSRLEVLQISITDIQKSLETETKSSAGDKHETGRAMLQLEREKAGQQLADIKKQFELLNKINPEIEKNTVALGSIVFTSKSNYFLGVSVGELKVGTDKFYAISMVTPMARVLVSKSVGETATFRKEQITITKIL